MSNIFKNCSIWLDTNSTLVYIYAIRCISIMESGLIQHARHRRLRGVVGLVQVRLGPIGPGTRRGLDARGPVLMHAGKVSVRRGRSAYICVDQDYASIPSLSFYPFISREPRPHQFTSANSRFPSRIHAKSIAFDSYTC